MENPDLKKLEKQVRYLEKKLNRSNTNRLALEKMWDRNSTLFQTLNGEIEEQKEIIKNKRDELEGLATKLAKYLSPQVYSSIFTGDRDVRIETYRKKLTIFFSDIVGFTKQTDHMEPEDLTFVLNTYLDKMAQIVLKYGGTLDKFIGDAVLVFFGDPQSKGVKNDAISAVKMAIEMQTAISEMESLWRDKGIATDFSVRMGMSSGYCTVGNFGSEERMDYTIIGNQVNMASRLESNARPGHILVSNDTMSLVQDEIQCIAKNPIQVKGFDRDIDVYEVLMHNRSNLNDDSYRAQIEGLSLIMNTDQIKPENRNLVITKLHEAIEKLSNIKSIDE
ncbi:MAG: hypothetical protein KAI79_16350 [Bacteroidales bacterium]|nr:hypothetical protein [Bacteroidales bacterium]